MSNRIRTRFAPSPTGYMHIGNLRTALYGYLFAKSQGGDFILRIEDTDQERFVEGAREVINESLAAAHIIADESPEKGGAFGPYVQSERKAIYKEYAEKLVASGHAYRCFCSAKVHAHESESEKFGGYDRHCRDLAPEEIERRLAAGTPYVIRQKMPLTGSTTYRDLILGSITIENSELEDQILLKSDGMPTYNFANVVDDHLMEITHVIRGNEYITSTPKHVLLYEFFGWQLPEFIHLPPVMGKSEDGTVSKLSKRHGAASFGQLLDEGYLAEAVTNYVALLGWSPKDTNQEIFTMEELIGAFSLDGISKSPAIFDYKKLDWMNGEYFKSMDPAAFAKLARPFTGDLPTELAEKWDYAAEVLRPRLSRLGEIKEQIHFLIEMPDYDLDCYTNKRNKTNPEKARALLPEALPMLDSLEPWTPDTINAALDAFAEQRGEKKGAVMWPLRIAVSGQKVTPGGLTEVLFLLGKKNSLDRLKKSLAKLQDM
ncbi:glutamate--tRNA ligase [Selenomonas sputigena]|uniref:Glutamate--tRNA ligase n=2 Tax=Selenomonas sputigena (strain ATCC 35185 / DSM 20758 / CCUG 44933 / VPI D19B-28) TaxID=546271 RepID=F4EXU5_SELS3|nr:glutamate--tRNA ligase [Selenomonas sputigena]AEB99152.1 glutamyl-tRNA synthetase [Selenomonas sputigena ATCC 35185]